MQYLWQVILWCPESNLLMAWRVILESKCSDDSIQQQPHEIYWILQLQIVLYNGLQKPTCIQTTAVENHLS